MASSSNSGKSPSRKDGPTQVGKKSLVIADNQPISSPTVSTSRRRKRRAPGNPKEDAVVVALTAEEILATHRFICVVCNKGHQRKQNLVLHMRSHNMATELEKRDPDDVPSRQKVYVCPVPRCVYNDPRRALGDITGIKKHYSRKHGEKRFSCSICSRSYALSGDLKAHSKTCIPAFSCSCAAAFAKQEELMAHKSSCDVDDEETIPESSTSSSDASPACSRFGSNTSIEFVENELPYNMLDSLTNASDEYHEGALSKNFLKKSANMDNSCSFCENTLPYPTYLNTTFNTFSEVQIHASSNTFPPGNNPSPASSSKMSNYINIIYENISESERLVPSSDVAILSTIPRSSLTIVDEHSFYCSKLQQSERNVIYKDYDMNNILSLSKDHPMLKKNPISNCIYPSPSNIPLSTYNFQKSSSTDNCTNPKVDLK